MNALETFKLAKETYKLCNEAYNTMNILTTDNMAVAALKELMIWLENEQTSPNRVQVMIKINELIEKYDTRTDQTA